MNTALESVLRREGAVIATALVLVTALAWGYVLWLAADVDMGGMDMSDYRMIPAGLGWMMPRTAPWSALEFALVFVMWAVMMVGMMLPSAAPMILLYARVGRHASERGTIFAATTWFAGGYLLAWTLFALLATTAQWLLDRALLLDAGMAGVTDTFGGLVLIAAGLYQWTPLKDTCLARCRAPIAFILQHGGFRADAAGALQIGLRHGAYCVGCCWALMALLFVGGVMNILWIAGLAILVLLEKVLPGGRLLSRLAGAGFVAAGIWLLAAGSA